MYCGGCLRDNALVAALRKLGHEVLMVPLYLPLTLDEEDQSAGTPIFFGGINVYLEQKAALFRGAPGWLHDLFASRPLLQWAAGRAAKTRAADLGELTLSMLRGEAGNQAREIEELIAWLKTQPKPDVLCLSNALLIGMARRLKADLGVPVACALARRRLVPRRPARNPSRGLLADAGRTRGGGGPVRRAKPVFRGPDARAARVARRSCARRP